MPEPTSLDTPIVSQPVEFEELFEPEYCETCNGGGSVDPKGKPWNRLNDPMHTAMIRAGRIEPEICRDCAGTGVKRTAEQKKVDAKAWEAIDRAAKLRAKKEKANANA